MMEIGVLFIVPAVFSSGLVIATIINITEGSDILSRCHFPNVIPEWPSDG